MQPLNCQNWSLQFTPTVSCSISVSTKTGLLTSTPNSRPSGRCTQRSSSSSRSRRRRPSTSRRLTSSPTRRSKQWRQKLQSWWCRMSRASESLQRVSDRSTRLLRTSERNRSRLTLKLLEAKSKSLWAKTVIAWHLLNFDTLN